jgi:hypothetical protein
MSKAIRYQSFRGKYRYNLAQVDWNPVDVSDGLEVFHLAPSSGEEAGASCLLFGRSQLIQSLTRMPQYKKLTTAECHEVRRSVP